MAPKILVSLNPMQLFPKVTAVTLLSLLSVGLMLHGANPQGSRKPLSKAQVLELLQSGVSSGRIEELCRSYGVSFSTTSSVQADLRKAGASEELINALANLAPKPVTLPPKGTSVRPTKESPASLLVSVDAPATVTVDGEAIGDFEANNPRRIPTVVGDHLVRAVSKEDLKTSVTWTGKTEPGGQLLVLLKLADQLQSLAQKREGEEQEKLLEEKLKPFIGQWASETTGRKSWASGRCKGKWESRRTALFTLANLQGNRLEGKLAVYRVESVDWAASSSLKCSMDGKTIKFLDYNFTVVLTFDQAKQNYKLADTLVICKGDCSNESVGSQGISVVELTSSDRFERIDPSDGTVVVFTKQGP